MSENLKILLGVLTGALVVLVLVAVFSGGSGMGGMGSMMSGRLIGGGVLGMGAGTLGMLLVPLVWILAIALIVALVVWIVRQVQHR
jgi:hypothetical protein